MKFKSKFKNFNFSIFTRKHHTPYTYMFTPKLRPPHISYIVLSSHHHNPHSTIQLITDYIQSSQSTLFSQKKFFWEYGELGSRNWEKIHIGLYDVACRLLDVVNRNLIRYSFLRKKNHPASFNITEFVNPMFNSLFILAFSSLLFNSSL